MLPEIGATELLVIAAVALIVVGPKDLPMLMRKVGQFMAKLRGMAAEFRASFDEMARQSELDDLRKEVEAMRRGQVFTDAAADASNAQVGHVFSEIEQGLADSGAQFPPMSHPYGETSMSMDPTDALPPPAAVKPKTPRKPSAKAAPSAKAGKAPAEGSAAKPRTPKPAAAKAMAAEAAAPKPRARKAAAPKAGAGR